MIPGFNSTTAGADPGVGMSRLKYQGSGWRRISASSRTRDATGTDHQQQDQQHQPSLGTGCHASRWRIAQDQQRAAR